METVLNRPRPQRLAPPSPPGSLLKRAVERPQQRAEADRDPDYLGQIRACPCLHCGMEPSEAAHVRYASAAFGKASGMGKTPSDRFALPLCAEHHRLSRHAQHHHGERQWWEALGINPLICAENLYACRGDLVAMRAVIFLTISQREK